MKKYIWSLFLVSFLFACKDEAKVEEKQEESVVEYTPITDEDLETAVIYEANIRQYSEAGTFNEFTKDIPELKELGVKVIWLMPIFPISEKNRKAKGDLMVEDIEDMEERKKYLGSYYAVADYTGINPDLGTEEDLDALIKTAHDNGMFVILDWVANHTGWDNKWVTEHPEWYTQNEAGEIIHPAGTDWTDTADLNYDNQEMRDAMTASMKYWVEKHNIDGFRCDVAHEVPTDFWNANNAELETIKPLFMLAESEKKDLFDEAFDIGYNWEGHHIMNELAQGKADVNKWDAYMKKIDTTYPADHILMNFITNHDENSWNGTVQERMGKASDAMLVFQYVIPGMPLVYSGQEYGMDKRLKFFEKDSIPKTKGRVWEQMKQLGTLKNSNSALHGGKDAAAYKRLITNDDASIYAIERSKNGQRVIFVSNLSNEPIKAKVSGLNGEYRDLMSGATVKFQEGMASDMSAYAYLLLEPIN
ncbi:alpha-amylase family glycosyl hydrolase [Nonlabens marinus]|uniref:1,4-alpha-glucan branching enzyme n=1 Tax=Nonlabens marinus S1-08 TaxID=1454201 RepID=W8VPD4_9FLAO|nr:alpha-amylase family glycosyl hydrolase [Nonlabens marinus]BAO54420.1 1,4-alpha-glucan branching enzyme [Nonlabens marinus S1-08]